MHTAFMLGAMSLFIHAGCGGDPREVETDGGDADADVDADADADADADGDGDVEMDGDGSFDADEEGDPDADIPVGVSLSGVVTFSMRPISARGLGAPTDTPARGVSLRLIGPGGELGRTSTDEEGRYSFEFGDDESVTARIRVVAMADSRRSLEVTDFDGAVYAVVTEDILIDGAIQVDIPIDERANSGAFAIFDTMDTGLTAAEVALERTAPLPPVRVLWERGRITPGGTSYADGEDLWILGGPDDTDEYDTSVLVHELGHNLQRVYSTTTWGDGYPHAGRETDPRHAWSEGWASFFASMVLDSPLYMDSVGDEVWLANDLSNLPNEWEFRADPHGPMSQTLSEWLVASGLWHLLDASSDRALQERRSMQVFSGWLSGVPAIDRGVEGQDFVDFLDGYLCLHDGADRDIIDGYIVRDRGFPYDSSPACSKSDEPPEPHWSPFASPGKPGRPRLATPLVLRPDGVCRGALVMSVEGVLLREVTLPVSVAEML